MRTGILAAVAAVSIAAVSAIALARPSPEVKPVGISACVDAVGD